MRKRTTLRTLLCALAVASLLHAQLTPPASAALPPLPPPRPGFSFEQNQTLTYTVDWRVFSAGTAVIHFEAVGDREETDCHRRTTIGGINGLLFHASDPFQGHLRSPRQGLHVWVRQADRSKAAAKINSTLKMDYAQSKSILDEKEESDNRPVQARRIPDPLIA